MRALLAIILGLAVAGQVSAGTDPQFAITFSKDNGGDGNFKLYYATTTGEFVPYGGPVLLINSPTEAYGVVTNKANKVLYVERDPGTGSFQLKILHTNANCVITGGPWTLQSDPNYHYQFPTITYDKRLGFTRQSVAGGPATEEVFVATLHRKKKTQIKWMKPATSNAVQDTQAFLGGIFRGIYYVRDGSIYYRLVNTGGPIGVEKLVLPASPGNYTYSEPAVSKGLKYLTYIKTDAAGNQNLFRVTVDQSANILEGERQLTFTSLPAKVLEGMYATSLEQIMWIVDRGDGYQEIWRQWTFGNPPWEVEAPRVWRTGAYGDRFRHLYVSEP